MRKLGIALMALLMAAALTACGKEKTMDVEQIGTSLLNDITYTDTLAAVDLETAGMIFYLNDTQITKAAIYESGGATAEEIAAFECASPEDADKVMTALQQRVEEQKESFADYVPEELPKLDNAVLIKQGNVVVLSVSGDPETAKKIIEGKSF